MALLKSMLPALVALVLGTLAVWAVKRFLPSIGDKIPG